MVDKIIKNRDARKYFYMVGVAIAGLLVGYNVITVEESGLWLNFAVALLGLQGIVAVANTPRHKTHEQEDIINADDVTEV